MVFDVRSLSFDSNSDTESEGKIGFCPVLPRMVFAGPSSSASTGSDIKSGGKMIKLVMKVEMDSGRPRTKALRFLGWFSASNSIRTERIKLVMKWDVDSGSSRSKALRLIADFPGVKYVALVGDRDALEVSGSGIDAVLMATTLRKKIGHAEIVSVANATEPNHTFPTSVRITELQPDEDTDLERKTSPGMLISGERKEQSEKQQEGQLPPGQDDCYVSQVNASLFSHPLPSMPLPLACEDRPSPSPVSPSSQGTSDQKQATPDHLSELSIPFAPSSSCNFWTKSLADMPALSNISGDACLPRAMKLMEENGGLQGHDQLCETAVHHHLSGIHGNGEIKQAEELEPKVSMANVTERRLMDMLHKSEESHDKTKRELALMREKLNEANSRIKYLEAAVSGYQNRIVVAEMEKEKAEERASRAGDDGETVRSLVRALRLQGALP